MKIQNIYAIFGVVLLLQNAKSHAQCPQINGAMINSCGGLEGANEFVVFTTSASAPVSAYNLKYGSSTAPNTNNLSGADATTKTGTGTVSAANGCSIVEVTTPSFSIPAGKMVMFIPANFDQNYDLSSVCAGGTLYVAYIQYGGGTSSNWAVNGTFSNNPNPTRGLQVTYSDDSRCNTANAPIKTYGMGWSSNTDGNFVSWNGTTPTYINNGCAQVALPIELEYFHVSCGLGEKKLTWQTRSESNTAYFSVQQSQDAVSFKDIAKVNAAGNSTQTQSYTYNDNSINNAEDVYYRLASIDLDGKTSFSKIVKTSCSKSKTTAIHCYPQPATGLVNVQWTSQNNGTAVIKILSVRGELLLTKTVAASKGMNVFPLDIRQISAGVYFMQIMSEDDKLFTKLIVR